MPICFSHFLRLFVFRGLFLSLLKLLEPGVEWTDVSLLPSQWLPRLFQSSSLSSVALESILLCLQTQLTSADRRRLRGKAQLLEPVLKVGRNGVTDTFVASVDTELALHELIKIKFVDFKEQRHELAEKIAAATGSALVQVVGHVAVFYRKKAGG